MLAVNQLPKTDFSASPTKCCPRFNPDDWEGETLRFKDKLFMKVATRSFMHVPLNMAPVMKKAQALIDAAKAKSGDEYIMFSDDVSPWKAEHYISVSRNVAGADMVRLSGTYLTKVFEGPYSNAGKWYRQLRDFVHERGEKLQKIYFYYPLCPSCAKKYGKNYVVGVAQLEWSAVAAPEPHKKSDRPRAT